MFVCGGCGERRDSAGVCSRDGTPLSQVTDPMLGTIVGRYRLTRLLGEGGMGRVYAAMHVDIGARVAIKIIGEEHAHNRTMAERFFAEARAVNLIAGDGIARIHDLAWLPDGRPYIVMELLEGSTLRDRIRAGALPIPLAVAVISDVLSALDAAHEAGVIHRDLKPDNIMAGPSSGSPTTAD